MVLKLAKVKFFNENKESELDLFILKERGDFVCLGTPLGNIWVRSKCRLLIEKEISFNVNGNAEEFDYFISWIKAQLNSSLNLYVIVEPLPIEINGVSCKAKTAQYKFSYLQHDWCEDQQKWINPVVKEWVAKLPISEIILVKDQQSAAPSWLIEAVLRDRFSKTVSLFQMVKEKEIVSLLQARYNVMLELNNQLAK